MGLFTAILATSIPIIILAKHWNEGNPYYSNGGQATYVNFLFDLAQEELFHKVTSMQRDTFMILIATLRSKGLLVDGRLATAEEQVLIILKNCLLQQLNA
ncbi:hypothetical protein PGTUg99_029381 [Puccinia graminis f. sp. tritici]|uniref:Uncharacterized protein n=1 Tax=Puccinia graminis f. sp. tritici TaxID=56615 RepID=A0A5B0P6Y6_PUCGR|nr:hypothetical protein PGTUg99_029381 [Puccinia graminis f. sp. tritici]